MSEMKHTPGPWLYRPQEHDDWGVVRAGDSWRGFICQAKDPVIWREDQFAEHRRNGTDPWEANARLIAAAPDLYEALVAALPRLAHPVRCHRVRPAAEWAEHGSASFENCDCEISVARAALAKATHNPIEGGGL